MRTGYVSEAYRRNITGTRMSRLQPGRWNLHVLYRVCSATTTSTNWAYQPSFVSSNTAVVFFNGCARRQFFLTEHLKIEPVVYQRMAVVWAVPTASRDWADRIKWTPNENTSTIISE